MTPSPKQPNELSSHKNQCEACDVAIRGEDYRIDNDGLIFCSKCWEAGEKEASTPTKDRELNLPSLFLLRKDANNALRCLFIAVDKSVADDVNEKVNNYISALENQLGDAICEKVDAQHALEVEKEQVGILVEAIKMLEWLGLDSHHNAACPVCQESFWLDTGKDKFVRKNERRHKADCWLWKLLQSLNLNEQEKRE